MVRFILFLKHNKKWWLTPIVIALLLIAVIAIQPVLVRHLLSILCSKRRLLAPVFKDVNRCESVGDRAAGFIGFHLCSRLLNDGVDVYGVDSLNEYYDVQIKHARLAQLRTSAV